MADIHSCLENSIPTANHHRSRNILQIRRSKFINKYDGIEILSALIQIGFNKQGTEVMKAE